MPFLTKTIKSTKHVKTQQTDKSTKYCGGFPEETYDVSAKVKLISELFTRLKYCRARKKFRDHIHVLLLKKRRLKVQRRVTWPKSHNQKYKILE